MAFYGYKHSGFIVEHGPVEAPSLGEAKAIIRRRLGVARLPWGFQVWDLTCRPLKTFKAVS